MAFTWTQTIGQYVEKIEAQDIQELRDKTDFLLTNRLYCGANYGYYSGNYAYCGSHLTSHLWSYYYSNNGYCSSHVGNTMGTYNPCDNGGTCFPAGVKVLLSNCRWCSIEDIRPGDEVMSFYGKANKVLDIYNTRLGPDRVMMAFPDRSLIFTPEEALWARNEKEEYWTVSDYDAFLKEEDFDYFVNGINYSRGGLNRKPPLIQEGEFEYAHLCGWIKQTPIFRREFTKDTVVYNLIVEEDFTYIVDGYITYGAISDEKIDFTKYKWNGLDIEIFPPFYLSDSTMIKRAIR